MTFSRHFLRQCINTCPKLLATAALGILVLAACSGGASGNAPTPAVGGETLRVVTTLYPLEYFARRIAGPSAQIVNLVAPGVEAHDFEPAPADIRQLDAAHVIIYNGAGFEPWIDRALAALDLQGKVIVEASQAVQADANQDPHLWVDPVKAIGLVEAIAAGLGQARPEMASTYAASAAALRGELEQLDGRYRAALANCKHRQFFTSHAAFSHLAQRYGLEQVAISGVTPEAEPSPGDLARLADALRASGIRHVLVEPVISPRLASTLAQETGATVLPLHPLESLTPEEAQRGEDYFSIMDANLRSLRTALECE